MPSSFTTVLHRRVSKVLRKWDEERWDAPEQRQKLSWVHLVELLSYQFAFSLRWVKFRTCSLSNTSPSVSSRLAYRQRSLAWRFPGLRPNTRPRTIRLVVFAVNAASPATAGPALSIENVPIRAVDILAGIVSQKLKKQFSEIHFPNLSRSSSTANRRFKTRSWATFKASFHPPLTRVRSFRWRSLALPLDLAILAISANIQLVSCRVPLVARCPVALIFQCESSSLQDMGSRFPARRHRAAYCYYYGARQTPRFRSRE